MIKAFFKHISLLSGFGIIIFLIHYLLSKALTILHSEQLMFDVHIFMFLLTAGGIIASLYLLKKRSQFVGFAFVGVSVLKMLLSTIFLYPIIKGELDNPKVYVVQFIIIYFVYLAYEVLYIINLLKSSNSLDE
ncbi:MAG TPA: hypothetical protein PLO05_03445 [Bacteroidales bacterium]|nr:hypothetical protein [Bacteroidales bacterium]HXK81196.1 hypothetical protein [Bacteroidales bacterium]